MAARKIARTVDEFHKSDKGQAFQQQHRNAQRLNVMTKPEEITDYLNRNNDLKPFIAVAHENEGVLYGIKLDHDRTTQRLFFRHAMRPDLRMQMSLMLGWHGHKMGPITAATGLELDKQGHRPDALFTPMIQAVLSHTALEQQAWRLATATDLPIADAREIITVPWMPFFARQIARHPKLSLRNAARVNNTGPFSGPGEIGALSILHAEATHVVMQHYLQNGVPFRSVIQPKHGQPRSVRFQESVQIAHLQEIVITNLNACAHTLRLAGKDTVQNKPWAIDLLHETRLYANGLSLFVPNRPADDPDTLYFELCHMNSFHHQARFVVDRRGEVHVTTGSYPLVPIHEIRTMAHAIPSRYPLPQRYP